MLVFRAGMIIQKPKKLNKSILLVICFFVVFSCSSDTPKEPIDSIKSLDEIGTAHNKDLDESNVTFDLTSREHQLELVRRLGWLLPIDFSSEKERNKAIKKCEIQNEKVRRNGGILAYSNFILLGKHPQNDKILCMQTVLTPEQGLAICENIDNKTKTMIEQSSDYTRLICGKKKKETKNEKPFFLEIFN